MKGFVTLDYLVLVGYLLLITSIGASFYRQQTTTSEYFLGGRRMSWLPVGISILAADTSAVTLMGLPAWSFQHNLELVWMNVGYALAAPAVIYLFIPFYAKLELFTAYEYLERRFNLGVRLVTSLLFQLLRGTHVAIAIYAPAMALTLVTHLALWQCIIIMGVITTIYTACGGMKAVIWTDVIQFCTVCLGLAFVYVIAIHQLDGRIASAWKLAADSGRLRIVNFSLDPGQTTSVWACLIGGMFLSLSSLTTDQAILQRLFTTKSKEDCVQSVVVNAAVGLPMMSLLLFLGVILFVFYRQNPNELAELKSPDGILPLFAIRHLPPGVSGLVISAIFGASMGVMSASINSLATATTIDFYRRLVRTGASPQHYAAFGRFTTAAWGVTATVLALFMNHIGELALAYNKVSSFISTPLLGIFLLGVLSSRCTASGALGGAAVGTVVVAALSTFTKWSFFYQLPVGVALTFAAGYALSLFGDEPRIEQIRGLVIGCPGPTRAAGVFTGDASAPTGSNL